MLGFYYKIEMLFLGSEQPISTVYASASDVTGQPLILGDVVHHALEDDTSIEAIDDEEFDRSEVQDDSFDSLTITLNMTNAPKQATCETQL